MSIEPLIEPDSAVYKTLLESTKAIPWRIDWATMTFSYIGPQIEALLGWTPQSWATVDDWVERMHPDDREYVVNFCVSQSRAGVDHEADYRALIQYQLGPRDSQWPGSQRALRITGCQWPGTQA